MHYYSKIKGIKETEQGTDLVIHIPGESLGLKISKQKIYDAEIRLDDGRSISTEQRKKIYASVKDIADYIGDDPEYLKEYLKYDYCSESGENYFSLSSCSIDTARNFITHIIAFVLKENIPLSDLAINRTDDINSYLYYCLKYRRCCISGKPADIHHVEGYRIGMGGNRNKISNRGRELIALSREWHNKVHQQGEEEIFKAYKVYGIVLDSDTLRELKILNEDIR